MTAEDDLCLCEYGPRLGDWRIDSNRCPAHDMTHAELLEYAANGWKRVDLFELAVAELLEVANLRGDNDLPHPADDPELWTARMQNAWNSLANIMRN